ncbi:uncharacterized protein LOC118477191 [Aplysia californica]|uniref:Uncharacterized protein LOC118477191 n=1 Tax=Aplysia californica TaxID=6500 RepID=A0ABM1W002_APLCA|nr:uncharacterized protein LOC118477191 [Aplysia californica]
MCILSRTRRVDPKDTFYTGACENGDDTTSVEEYQLNSFCYCDVNGQDRCGPGNDIFTCPYMEIDENDVTDRLQDQALFPLKCLDIPFSYSEFPLFEYDESLSPAVIDISLPTDSGQTYEILKFQCTTNLNSLGSPYPIARTCKDVDGVRMTSVVESCALDLYVTSDFNWIQAAVQSMKVQCQLQLERNSSLWTGSPSAPPQEYTNLFCIANCGGAGTCEEGVCKCIENYGGADCYVNKLQPPNVFSLSNGGFCDLRDENCDNVIVYMNNTENSNQLSCYLKRMLTNSSGTFSTGDQLTKATATFLSVNELSCSIPSGSGTYEIIISGDGQRYSSPVYLFVYNSLCFDCAVNNQTCMPKVSGCLINGVCYENGEYNPSSLREYCDPAINATVWQTAQDSCQGLPLIWLEDGGFISGGESVVGDKESCKQMCLSQYGTGGNDCYSFDYNATSGNCSLNSADKRSDYESLIADSSSVNLEWNCENNPCHKENVIWTRKPGFAILGSGDKIVSGITSSFECRKRCLSETSFLCRSVQLLGDAGMCVLWAETSISAGNNFVRWPGYIFEEWSCASGTGNLLPLANPSASIVKDPSGGSEDYTLSCNFKTPDSTNATLQANIEWLVDNTVVEVSNIWTNQGDQEYNAHMNRAKLTNLAYGTKLSCGVSLCLNESCSETIGAFRRSNRINLILEVKSLPELTVTEGQRGEVISVVSNAPPSFLCDTYNSSSDCSFMIRVQVNHTAPGLACPLSGTMAQVVLGSSNTLDDADADGPFCGHIMTNRNWQTRADIAVVAKLDLVQDDDVKRTVHVSGSLVAENMIEIIKLDLQDVEVTVVNQDFGGVCVSMNDPHMITFDRRYYKNFNEGEFILYQHASLPYEIRGFYRRCKGKELGSCTCAVAARSGDDVLVIDRCGAKDSGRRDMPFLDLKLYQIGKLIPGTTVRRVGGGLKYEVGLPTGTVLEVDVKDDFLNVLIIASATDFNNTKGLCGLYDGDKDTMLTKRDGTVYDSIEVRPDEFSLSWRVDVTESLYTGFCGTLEFEPKVMTLCDCQGTYNGTCQDGGELITCSRTDDHFNYWKGEDITLDLQERSQSPMCEVSKSVGQAATDKFEYDPDQNAGDASWPTASNITEPMAEAFCGDVILNDIIGAACNQIIPDTVKYAVQACVKDIQISDDRSWAQSALSTVLSVCRYELFNNPAHWVNSTGTLSINSTFIGGMCFNQCSQHGPCVDGVCDCEDGYGLADCSVNTADSPDIYMLENDGLCNIQDSSQRPCDSVLVTGRVYAFSEQLKCRLQPIKITESDTEDDGKPVTVQAEYFSFHEITCPLPEARSYRIQVTNNNVNFSDSSTFTLYHPRCHDCSSSGVCKLTFESCFIDNECFLYGEPNPANESLVCDNYQSYDSWSLRKEYPYVRGNPVLSSNFNDSTREFTFSCEVTVQERQGVEYLIEWRHNGTGIAKVNISEVGVNTTVAFLDILDIPQFALGSDVSCALTACFAENCSTTESPPEESNSFTAAIKITDEKVTVTEGMGPATISAESNVPPKLLCVGEDPLLCNVFATVQTNQPEPLTCPNSDAEVPQLIFPLLEDFPGITECGVQYSEWPGIVKVPVKAALDSLIDGDVTRLVEVAVQVEYNMTVEVLSAIGKKEVLIIDNDSATLCASVNDPHMTSFDGRTYDVYLEGEFILYQHSSMMYEVHSFYRKCNKNRAACNCAVTVKSGDDVILIDRCGAKSGTSSQPLEVKILKNGELTPNTRVVQLLEGRKYKVILPTGTEVKVNVASDFLNVWIQPSAADFNSSRGLCGTYNKESDDDLTLPSGSIYPGDERQPNSFSLSWRVNASQSHYRGVCAESDAPLRNLSIVCQCSVNGTSCIPDLGVSRCLPSGDNPNKNGQGVDVTSSLLNSSVQSSGCNNLEQFEYEEDYVSGNFSWPTPSGWEEENATDFCVKFLMKSEIGFKCANKFSVDFNRTVRGCVSDIQIMDDTVYAIQALTSLLEQCLSSISRTVEFWIDMKPDTEFLNLLCPEDCNGNGKCTNGLCVCEKDYGGVDCSVDLTVAPDLAVLLPSVSCDVKDEDCSEIILIGGPFVNSNSLICIFQQIDYFDGISYSERENGTYLVQASFTTYERIECRLPFIGSFTVKVENSLGVVSQTIVRQVYNSECFSSCDDKRCVLEPKYCFIDNECYRVNEINSDDVDLVCDPQKSLSHWTDRNEYPRLDALPEIETRFDFNTSMFYLGCDWSGFTDNDTTLTVFAQWYQEDEFIAEEEIERNVTSAEISHVNFTGLAYGKKVYCGLVACITTRCNETRSPLIKSEDFVLEIKIVNPSVEIQEGEDKAIRVTSTFPPAVFCDVDTNVSCSIFIGFEVQHSKDDIVCPVTNETVPQLVFWGLLDNSAVSCGVVLTNENWQTALSVLVRAVVDGKTDGDQERSVNVTAVLSHTITVSLQTFTVKVIDSDQVAVCQSINDPHMTTFDGRYYNNFNVGEFILYRHTTLPYEVRSYFRKCNKNRASCNCAVVVRAGDDTIRVDRCGREKDQNGKESPLDVGLYLRGQMTSGLSIVQYNDGKKYEIFLPSNTKVVVVVDSKYINVVIQASSFDFGNTEGLCGTYDGDKKNDLTSSTGVLVDGSRVDDFSLSWRVEQKDSIYSGFCGQDFAVGSTQTFCSCGVVSGTDCGVSHVSSCQEGLRVISGGTDITMSLKTGAIRPPCGFQLEFEYDTAYIPKPPSWPTPSGFNLTTATEFCEKYIQASISAQACLGAVRDLNLEFVLKGCVEDIQILDSTEFAASAVENLNMRCLTHVQVNISYWVTIESGVVINPVVFDSLCPADCNNNGNCSKGVCICDAGFGGTACDIDLTSPPKLTNTPEIQICDSKNSTCPNEILIFGENFLNSEQLTCHFKEITILETSISVSDKEIISQATFINFNVVKCTFPSLGSFTIAVSNTNISISTSINFLLFDSACVSCDPRSGKCFLVDDTCFIENKCYKFDEPSPENGSLSCQPFVSQTSFTLIPSNPTVRKPTISTSTLENSPYFEIQCSLGADEDNSVACKDGVAYEVKWETSTGIHLTEDNFKCGSKARFSRQDLQGDFELGDYVVCAVRACIALSCNGTYSEWRYSDQVSSAIQIKENELEVTEEAETVKIHLTSPFPPGFFCTNFSNWDICSIDIQIQTEQSHVLHCDGSQVPQVVVKQVGNDGDEVLQCGRRINQDTWMTSFVFEIKAVQDNLVEPDQKLMLNITADVLLDEDVHSSQSVGLLNLTVLDNDKVSQCAFGVHMSTFDSKYFNNYRRGEFIVYRHTSMPFEVRTLQQSCDSNQTCTCAVMVLSGNDVVVLDRCDGGAAGALDTRLYLNGDLTEDTRVIQFVDGGRYRIVLPTMTYIDVSLASLASDFYLEGVIHSSAKDFAQVDGLCGNNDDSDRNDFFKMDNSTSNDTRATPDAFIEHWRAEKSFLNGLCVEAGVNYAVPGKESYCQCVNRTQPVCGKDVDVFLCGVAPVGMNSIAVQTGTDVTEKLLRLGRPSSGCCQQTKEYDYSTGTDFEPPQLSWPTSSKNLTESLARDSCTKALNESQIMSVCSGYLHDSKDIERIVQQCVDDIQISEDETRVEGYMSSVLWACIDAVSSQVEHWTDVDGYLAPSDIDVCYNNCSREGSCLKGSCLCNDGFGSADCSVNMASPPTLLSILGGKICDVKSLADCTSVVLFGTGFADTQNLTCHFNENGTVSTSSAIFIASNKIVCSKTLTSSAEISVSLDGFTTSNQLTRTLYDGSCEMCDDSGCTRRDNLCSINGACYSCGSVFEDDVTRFCLPSNATDRWSLISDVFAKRYKFLNVQGSILETSVSNIAVTGDVKLVTGYGGAKYAQFSESGQSLTVRKSDLSLLETSSCTLGFTLRFYVKFTSICEDGYVLRTWRKANESGLSVSICDGSARISVRTRNKEMSVRTGAVKMNSYIEAEISWSDSLGLSVVWDGKTYATTRYTVLNHETGTGSDLVLGSSGTETCWLGMVLGGLEIFTAPKPVLESIGIITELPTLPARPTVEIFYEAVNATTTFSCSFESLGRGDVRYKVEWFVDDMSVKQIQLGSSQIEDVIGESEFENATFGSKIMCSVTPCYVFNCDDLSGPTFSASYEITVTIVQSQITVTEGAGSSAIKVIPTVPPYMLCKSFVTVSSETTLQVSSAIGTFSGEQICPQGNALRQVVVGGGNTAGCSSSVSSQDWQSGAAVPIVATVDLVKDGDVRGNVNITASVECEGKLEILISKTVEVTVIDKDIGKQCQSVNDPHIQTFDGVSYDNFKEGEFTLYQHTELPYAVHTFYRRCNRGIASCNCAVAVRVEDDVILIDKCGPGRNIKKRASTVKLIRNGDVNPGFKLQRYDQGNQYHIIMPSGTTVIVESSRNGQFLNVWVTVSSADYGHTMGLCGSYDDDKSNEFFNLDGIDLKIGGKQQKQFSEYWRVKKEQSIYSGFCPEDIEDRTSFEYCNCVAGAAPTCGSDLNLVACKKDSVLETSIIKIYEDITAELVASSEEPEHCFDPLAELIEFEFNINYTFEFTNVFWPTPSGIEYEHAKDLCGSALMSSSLSAAGCGIDFTVDVESAIEFCINDIKMTDDTSWTVTMLNNIRIQCITQITLNVTQQIIPFCPNECSGVGTCFKNYVCFCGPDYGGFDCSINLMVPPILFEIVGGNLCDHRLDPDGCKQITVTGSKFSQTVSTLNVLQCHLKRLVVGATDVSVDVTKTEIVFEATFISLEEVRCNVDQPGSWEVSISNKEGYVSLPLVFISFDSNCQVCSLTGCTIRDDVCNIGGECYENGATKPDDNTQICNTKVSNVGWTQVTVPNILELIQRYIFIRIEGNFLVTPTFQLQVFGTPTLIDGPAGGNAILFNGINEYLSLMDLTGTCLGDLSKCIYGLTIKFSLAINEFRNDMYILSCGGDTKDTSGLSIWWKGSHLRARVRTETKEWKVSMLGLKRYLLYFTFPIQWPSEFKQKRSS